MDATRVRKRRKIMSELEIFRSDEFGEVRTIVIDGTPWFVGKDVAENLGYQNGSRDINRHVDIDDRSKIMMFDGNQDREVIIINESGLYSLILSSKLPTAKKFKHWVTSEVLPTIRKTGGYVNNADLMVNTYFSDLPDEQKILVKGLMSNIEKQQKKITCLSNENDLLAQKNLKWADRPLINSLVRAYAKSVGGDFAKAWNCFKKELMYKHSINLNSRITNYLNTSGKKTKPKTLDMLEDFELPNAISTIVSMCRENDVVIDELIANQNKL